MRKLFKIPGYLFVFIAVLIAGFLAYFFLKYPRVEPPPEIQVKANAEMLAHGEYLAMYVTGCVACHSERDRNYYSEPIVEGTEGKGGLFGTLPGLGTLYAPNITPYSLKEWSDGEIVRAMISGVSKDGRALFPIMPYNDFAHLTNEDVEAIVAYIRTLEPKPNDVPVTNLDFPLSLIVRTMPVPRIIGANPITDRGEYLTTIASCKSCHTPMEKGQAIPGMQFAGGQDFLGVKSANITPDDETGIGKWSKSDFIFAFKRFAGPDARQIAMPEGTPNTVMPWTLFSHMTEEDLGAIYNYLRTVKAVKNKVERFSVPQN